MTLKAIFSVREKMLTMNSYDFVLVWVKRLTILNSIYIISLEIYFQIKSRNLPAGLT